MNFCDNPKCKYHQYYTDLERILIENDDKQFYIERKLYRYNDITFYLCEDCSNAVEFARKMWSKI